MSEKPEIDPWKLPFAERFLRCADALAKLEFELMVVGLGGNRNFESLRADFVKHGGVTYNNINRN